MFPIPDAAEKIKKIQQGDRLTREIFLENSKPFIYKQVCRFSGRTMDWNRDDELAVALIAFNEALDRYRDERGVPFPAFAGIVIRSRLTDYYRKENKHAAGFLLPGNEINGIDSARSWDTYLKEETEKERAEEIKEFGNMLEKYGVNFEDLVKSSPKHSTTRRDLMQAARVLAGQKGLWEKFKNGKKLPLNAMIEETGIGRKTLERGRKYIIAMALLISRREEFLYLSSYLNLTEVNPEGG